MSKLIEIVRCIKCGEEYSYSVGHMFKLGCGYGQIDGIIYDMLMINNDDLEIERCRRCRRSEEPCASCLTHSRFSKNNNRLIERDTTSPRSKLPLVWEPIKKRWIELESCPTCCTKNPNNNKTCCKDVFHGPVEKRVIKAPVCYKCGDALRTSNDQKDKFTGNLNMDGLTHPYKMACGLGMTRGSSIRVGAIIPEKCSRCDGLYDHQTGQMFSDHKTVACKNCADEFFEWKINGRAN